MNELNDRIPEPALGYLKAALADLAKVPDSEKVSLKGKLYTTVATRLDIFRRHFGCAPLTTKIEVADHERCVARSEIKLFGEVCATGHAEEWRGGGAVNKTSALENAETSAIGRALANLGLHGNEFASADEVERALTQTGGHPGSVPVPQGGPPTGGGRASPPPVPPPTAPPSPAQSTPEGGDWVGSELGLPPLAKPEPTTPTGFVFQVPQPSARNSWEDMAWQFYEEMRLLPSQDQLAGWFTTHKAQLEQMRAAKPEYHEQLSLFYGVRQAQFERNAM